MIRWTSPVRHFLRYLTEPATLSGVESPRATACSSRTRRPTGTSGCSTSPWRFDVCRGPTPTGMIAFGGGEHFCLGSTFARRELRTIFPKLLAAVETIELDGEPEWAQANFVGGVKHLPVAATFR